LVDDDIVDGTNLQRQVLFSDSDRGRSKVQAAADRLRQINSEVQVRPLRERVSPGNVRQIVRGHDLVIDGSDNFATRYPVNDACVIESIPLVSGSLYQYEGQVLVVDPPRTPCYRCVFPSPVPEQAACREVGVLGPTAGVVGALQAAEAMKWIATGKTELAGRLLLVDTMGMEMRSVKLRAAPECPLCGARPRIQEPTAMTGNAVASR